MSFDRRSGIWTQTLRALMGKQISRLEPFDLSRALRCLDRDPTQFIQYSMAYGHDATLFTCTFITKSSQHDHN